MITCDVVRLLPTTTATITTITTSITTTTTTATAEHVLTENHCQIQCYAI